MISTGTSDNKIIRKFLVKTHTHRKKARSDHTVSSIQAGNNTDQTAVPGMMLAGSTV